MSSNSNDKWLIRLVPRGDESLSAVEGWIKGPDGNRSGMVAWKKLNTGRTTKADVTALEELMGNVTIGQTYSVPQDVNVEEAMGLMFASMSLGTGDKNAGGRRRRRRSTHRKRTHRKRTHRKRTHRKRTHTTRRKRKRTAQKRRR